MLESVYGEECVIAIKPEWFAQRSSYNPPEKVIRKASAFAEHVAPRGLPSFFRTKYILGRACRENLKLGCGDLPGEGMGESRFILLAGNAGKLVGTRFNPGTDSFCFREQLSV